jgi:hypothetical protein
MRSASCWAVHVGGFRITRDNVAAMGRFRLEGFPDAGGPEEAETMPRRCYPHLLRIIPASRVCVRPQRIFPRAAAPLPNSEKKRILKPGSSSSPRFTKLTASPARPPSASAEKLEEAASASHHRAASQPWHPAKAPAGIGSQAIACFASHAFRYGIAHAAAENMLAERRGRVRHRFCYLRIALR